MIDNNIIKKDDFSVYMLFVKGQSHEKVDELRVWGVSLGPN
jgi:hypothetical protein